MGFFSRIKNRQDALKMIRDIAVAFYVLAVVLVVIAVTSQSPVWIDAAIYAALAFWFQKFNSRIAAVILLAISILMLVTTIARVFVPPVPGRNAILAVFMVISSIRAVEATFKLHQPAFQGEGLEE